MNANAKIRKAMRDNERNALARIKDAERKGGAYDWLLPRSRAWHNAIDRLEAKGRIRWSKAKRGYVVKGNYGG